MSVAHIETEVTHHPTHEDIPDHLQQPTTSNDIETQSNTVPASTFLEPYMPSETEMNELQSEESEGKTNNTSKFTIWIHKNNFHCITQDERDMFQEKIMIKYLAAARAGRHLDLRITTNFSDLDSGKIKMVTENRESIEAIRTLLDEGWHLLSPEDLSTSEGQAFWVFCPNSLTHFIQTDTLLELLRAHTGNFLEKDDLRMILPPKKAKDNRGHIAYIFGSYKAQVYYKHFKWRMTLIGCSLKLTPYGQPKGTIPKLSRDPSPMALVNALDQSKLDE